MFCKTAGKYHLLRASLTSANSEVQDLSWSAWFHSVSSIHKAPKSTFKFVFKDGGNVRMRTTLENDVLRNGQQPQSVVNGFYRPG